jgi:hypothetical protein
MRPPGGLTTDMFNFSNNINIYYEWANIILHNRFSSVYTRPYHCCYAGRKSSKPYQNSHEKVLKRCGDKLVAHESISGVFSAALGNYGYVLRSPDLAELLELVEFIQAKAA